MKDNYGNQSGDGSVNVGVGDFRGANVNISSGEKPTFTPEDLQITRHSFVPGLKVSGQKLGLFSIITGLSSVVGLYFTLFKAFPNPTYSSWSTLFLFSFGIAALSGVITLALKKRRFEPFLFRRFYLEQSGKGYIHLNRFQAICPWCGSKMNLRSIGPKDGPHDDLFVCERVPRQHTVLLDPSVLPDID